MYQPEIYWLFEQRVLLFHGWQNITKEMLVNKNYRYRMVKLFLNVL